MQADQKGEGLPSGVSPDAVSVAPPGAWPQFVDVRFDCFLRHWAERRQGGLMTRRSAVDPAAIRDCLPHVWIYRYLPQTQDFLCTLAGEQVNEAWGSSLIGKLASAFMPATIVDKVPPLYRRTLEMPAVQVSRRRIAPYRGLEQSAERLIVPLSNDDGTPYGVFGMTLYHLGDERRFAYARAVEGEVTFYACSGLPADLPP